MPDNRGLQVAILIWECAFCAIAALCMLFSIGLCMIIMFLAAMSELNQEMYMLSSSESKMKERLEIATVLNRCIAQLLSEEEDNVAIFNLQGIPLEMLDICFTAED